MIYLDDCFQLAELLLADQMGPAVIIVVLHGDL
jgi:hypothetical protein